jgi:hypothetical protein
MDVFGAISPVADTGRSPSIQAGKPLGGGADEAPCYTPAPVDREEITAA